MAGGWRLKWKEIDFERHEMVIHALLWVVSVVTGTAIAGVVSAGFVLVKLLAR